MSCGYGTRQDAEAGLHSHRLLSFKTKTTLRKKTPFPMLTPTLISIAGVIIRVRDPNGLYKSLGAMIVQYQVMTTI